MGKGLPHSNIHAKFSDWHWDKCSSMAYLSDIDRIWIEFRNDVPVAVYDLKWQGKDKPTRFEIILANWFELNKVPYYNIYINKNFSQFICYRHLTKKRKDFNEAEMIEWIDSGCNPWD